MHEKIDLNGFWDWKLPGGMWQRKQVPSSYLCVGTSIFRTQVDLHLAPGKQVFLCFAGIAYQGKAWFNDHVLGEMLPYVPYRFEVSEWVQGDLNEIRVEVEDITASYGPTGGWEDYGGITREVYLEVSDPLWIEDTHWLCELDESFTAAQCWVIVTLTDRTGAETAEIAVSVSLTLNQQNVYQGEKVIHEGAAEVEVAFLFTVQNPLLWSPDRPVLYDLVVSASEGEIRDEKRLKVGFREIKAVGSRLVLNGQDLFLKGVARHEMWGNDQGFTLTREQIEEDLRLIKNLGANFVRLVHYPHSRATIELCDSLGLLASEEPGLWWSDLTDETITSRALAIMEKTILRDRNSPSLIAWLLYNECVFAGASEYLARGKTLCNRLDPGRLVSAANCLDPGEARRVFDESGMDFYTFHPYSYEPNLMVQGVETLRGKPVVFTEWGGYLFVDTPNMRRWFGQVIRRIAHSRDPQPNLAGMAYWEFQDINQFSRGLPGCVDGSLMEGLVDPLRVKKPMYGLMADLFAALDKPEEHTDRIEMIDQLVTGEESRATVALDLSQQLGSAEQKAAWETVLSSLRVYQSIGTNRVRVSHGPELFAPLEDLGGVKVKLSGRPLILAGEWKQIRIECGFAVEKLYFLGQTTFFDGYPLRGRLGEAVAHYNLNYTDGSSETIPLRNGYELASASLIARTSRVNPLAANTRRVLTLHMDEDWEVYQVGCLEVEIHGGKVIESITFGCDQPEFNPLLYGISARIQADRDSPGD